MTWAQSETGKATIQASSQFLMGDLGRQESGKQYKNSRL